MWRLFFELNIRAKLDPEIVYKQVEESKNRIPMQGKKLKYRYT